ncbi:MAG: DNA polymerase III subunit gamma/tau [Bacteroidaceae bacterium]|nr:DNA polymerase III subunit gamma/tau [Bacteroidaceae bacterium]
MSNYTVSARKYRPVTFESVVGQEALTTTLKNAIASGKLANSYLFCGPRGVGKTTCARLFAKTINCEHPGPDGEACGECESCRSYNAELRSHNVFELDAASNNSVDDIRALTDQVRIPPIAGRYKVYIIDEVHMLSTAAFNAFLKTLEEPPSYAIFILATTEKHKVIPTILSRCQTYDFNRISNTDIIRHLKNVAARENIETDDDALAVIAEKADGGMRDALSIFDQVTSFTGGHVTYDLTIQNLNVIDTDHYFRMTDYLLEGKIPESLVLLNDIMSHGFDPSHLISGLLLHFRNLLVSRDACTLPLLEMSDEMRGRYQKQAARCQPKFLYRAMKLCNDCDLSYRASKNKRLLVELTLIRVSQSAVGEDDDSDGRGPKAKLKPIFSKSVQTTGQSPKAGTSSPVAPAPTSTAAAAPSGQPNGSGQPAPSGQPTGSGQSAPSGQPTGSEAKPSSGKVPKIPRIGASGLFTSIHGKASQQEASSVTEAGPKNAGTSHESEYHQVQPLAQERLDMFWKDYAVALPSEYAPLMNRMLNMKPQVVSDTEFSITVQNQMAADEFRKNQNSIESYLRDKFSNNSIRMNIAVDASRQDTRILSKAEQFDIMRQSNHALEILAREFSLEF